MSKVQIEFDQYVAANNATIVVEILNADLEQVTQVALTANRPLVLELNPGKYLVRAQLPSGEVLREQVSLPVTDSYARVQLSGTTSPHEWLSLQHYLGFLAATPVAIPAYVAISTWLRLWSFRNGAWQSEAWPSGRWESQNSTRAPQQVGEWGIVTRITLSTDRVWLLQIGGEHVPHRCIAIPPSPEVEILLRGTTRNTNTNGGVTLRISTLDADLEALMSYQTSGATAATLIGDEVAQRAEEYALDKRRNPNGAALGFYYLLSRQDLKRVHEWPRNFADWFQWLPDTAVIYAMQLLMTANANDRVAAKAMLVRAATGAVPVYTRGLRSLVDQLCTYKLDPNTKPDDAVNRALQRIEAYAAAANWNEPRTTFFGTTPDSPSPYIVFGLSDSSDAVYPHLLSAATTSAVVIADSAENNLIGQAQRGHPSAFEQLHVLYARELLGYLRARCSRKTDAEDIAQETWSNVLTKIKEFDPRRGNFAAFIKYWGGIAALRWHRKHNILLEQSLLSSEIEERFSEYQEADTEEIARKLRQAIPTPEELVAQHESYTKLLRTVFLTASPPHQLLAFGFCKLLEWKPQQFVEKLSDVILRQLAAQFTNDYLAEVPADSDVVHDAITPLQRSLNLTFGQVVKDPMTRATYPQLSDRTIGNTRLRDYYQADPEQNISHWTYAVRRRTLAALASQSDQGKPK